MKSSPSCPILEIKPNSVEIIRKEYNLDGPGRMEKAVNILRTWIQKQDHFKEKDFPPDYLERCIITSKGSIERAKKQIDRMCTIRTLTPEYFDTCNIKDIQDSLNVARIINMPKTTEDLYRITIIKILRSDYTAEELLNNARYCFIKAECTRSADYIRGFLIIMDLTGISILEMLKNANLFQIKHTLEVIISGYGLRLKGLHFVTDSKMVDVLLSFTKQIVSSKIAGRINVHRNYEELHKMISPSLLPKDFGGEEKSSKELMDKWIELLSSAEHVAYLEQMRKAGTDESRRLEKRQFNEECAGIAGTFRALNVD